MDSRRYRSSRYYLSYKERRRQRLPIEANVVDTASGLLKTFSRLRRLIIDSGTTDHINSSLKLLINSSKNIIMPPASMTNGEQAPVTSVGDLPLNSTFTLKNVFGVPSFKVDLLS